MPPVTTADSDAELLPRDVSQMIFEEAERGSAIQRLAPSQPLPDNGVAIPVLTGEPTAAWVTEGAKKPVSDATLGVKLMDPKKIAVIVPFSDEFLRTDRTNLPETLRDKIAGAFARAFDKAAIVATTGPFTLGLSSTTNAVELGTTTTANGGLDGDIVEGMRQVAADGYRVTGFAADVTQEPEFLDARDTTGRPIYLDNPREGSIGNTLKARPLAYGEGIATPPSGTPTADDGIRFIGGQWNQAAWGSGGQIEYDVSDSATLELADTSLLHLWQQNLVAIRAEAFYGWVVADVDAFVKYRDNV